jgi:hypothetical protein
MRMVVSRVMDVIDDDVITVERASRRTGTLSRGEWWSRPGRTDEFRCAEASDSV